MISQLVSHKLLKSTANRNFHFRFAIQIAMLEQQKHSPILRLYRTVIRPAELCGEQLQFGGHRGRFLLCVTENHHLHESIDQHPSTDL